MFGRGAEGSFGEGLEAPPGRGIGEDGNFRRRGRRRRKFLPHKELWRFVAAEIDFAKQKNLTFANIGVYYSESRKPGGRGFQKRQISLLMTI